MPTIQINCLGSFGRFGNQLFQYAFARAYAESVGATLETPWWIGRSLFCLDDPLPERQLPSLGLDEHPNGKVDVDLYGYFQRSDFFQHYTLSKLRTWFRFGHFWADKFPKSDKQLVAMHVRRGDYIDLHDVFCTVDEEAYIKAIVEAGHDPKKVVQVREDRPNNYPLQGFEFIRDFFTLYNADVLFRANSTFSWWAATLGQATSVYSPVVNGLKGHHKDVKFVEGNWPRCVDLPNVSDYRINP
jgi:hypothetical protein